jgi:DNA invertase Pin-like site-specific DNA recombinase
MLIGYARVSTVDQDPSLQLDALRAAGCDELFEERASGARSDRPVLAQAMKFAREGDTLVVWRLDRFGRSLKDLIENVQALRDKGVGFRSLAESVDTTTAGGQLVFHVFGALAEFERELIRERTLAGLAAARARGRKGGRPPKMTKRKVKQADRLLSDPQADIRAICETLGVSKSTLYTYVGPKGEVRKMPDK